MEISLNELHQKKQYLRKKKRAVFDHVAIAELGVKIVRTEYELETINRLCDFVTKLDFMPEMNMTFEREDYIMTKRTRQRHMMRTWFGLEHMKEDLADRKIHLEVLRDDLIEERDMRLTYDPHEIHELEKALKEYINK